MPTPRGVCCAGSMGWGVPARLSPRVSLGRATGDATADIPLFADVSRLHAFLSRDSEGGYLIEASGPFR